MAITICASPADVAGHIEAIDELAKSAAEPNVFCHPHFLIPALKYLAVPRTNPFVVLVSSDHPQRLIGLAPLEKRDSFHRMPLVHFRLWEHKHCFLSTPLVRRGFEELFFRELCGWAENQRPRPLFINLTQCGDGGPVSNALSRMCESRSIALSAGAPAARAFLDWSGRAEDYVSRYPKKMQKNIDRRFRHVRDHGRLRYSLLETGGSLAEWLTEFLAMEAAGWKGRSGTALMADRADRAFIGEALESAFRAGALEFAKLLLDDRVISMRICFVQQNLRFLFKITYDESSKHYSPGVLLEVEEMKRRLDGKKRLLVDSCSDPENEFMNSLFLERRAIRSFRLGLPFAKSKAAVSLVSLAEKFRQRMRDFSDSQPFRLRYQPPA